MNSPGAAMSTHRPPLLDDLVLSKRVEAATVMALSDLAGVQLHASDLPLPAATTGMTLAFNSFSTPRSNKSVRSLPPKDKTATPGLLRSLFCLDMTSSIELITSANVPKLRSSKVFTHTMRHFLQTPKVDPAAVPAI